MKRRVLSRTLALVLCIMMAMTAYAAPNVSFVVDEWDVLADSELAQLNEQAKRIYEDTGVGIFFIFSNEADLESLDPAQFAGDVEDYYIMIENDDYWWSYLSGRGEAIDLETEEILREAYDVTETYVDGIESYLYTAAECFPHIADTPQEDALEAEYLVYDEAYLLSDAEEAVLNQKLIDISHKYDAQIVICTIASMDGGDIDEFLEYLYDEMGFGYGENHDGVLLLVSMDPREYRILSNGFAGDAIDSGDIEAIGEAFVSDLSAGNYAAAFNEFADQCAYYLDGKLNGFPFNAGKNLLICLIIGVVAGVAVAFILKGQLKTVRKQDQANVYVKPGSMQVTVRNDFFLYRNVTRTKKESSSSSGGGSSRSTGGGSF